MKWLNSDNSYGATTIIIHWVMALGVIGMFSLGVYMVELDYYDIWYHRAPDIHKAGGLLLVFLLFLRITWHFYSKPPQQIPQLIGWQRTAAILTHKLLYLLLAACAVTGYLISTAEGQGVDFFGLWILPALEPFIKDQEDVAGVWHYYLTYSLIAVSSLHALAALKHHFIDKDDVLRRMLRLKQNS